MRPLYFYRVWALVERIDYGRVTSYKTLAWLEGTIYPIHVGYAMSRLPSDHALPWQRVITAAGRISAKLDAATASRQRQLLQQESVVFDAKGRVNFAHSSWKGPDPNWLHDHGYRPFFGMYGCAPQTTSCKSTALAAPYLRA